MSLSVHLEHVGRLLSHFAFRLAQGTQDRTRMEVMPLFLDRQ